MHIDIARYLGQPHSVACVILHCDCGQKIRPYNYSMRKILILVLCALLGAPLWAQISDQQVISIMRRGQAQGLNSEQIATQLVQSGATQDQLLRIKTQMESAANSPQQESATKQETTRLRTPPVKTESSKEQDNRETAATGELRDSVVVAPKEDPIESRIFGHNIFNNRNLTFEPALNIATPENYILGPGDEVIIDIWGNSQQTIQAVISPDGSIVANPVGLIRLNGLSVAQATARVRQSFGSVYALDGGTHLNLSLGQIRSIQVHVMGEVKAPGTYTVPSLATLFHVLYNAGGVNDIGSLRDIHVNRGGKEIAAVDVYDYLLNGHSDLDISLKDGDVVVVPPYKNLVAIEGKVKRPMIYELKTGETLGTLLGYSGGFAGDAYTKAVRVVRKSGLEYRVYNIEQGEYGAFMLTDCDSVSVGAVLERFGNRVEVNGAVFRPGTYALDGSVRTVKQLVEKAEGLRGDAFAGHAVLYRQKPDYTLEALSLDIGKIVSGEAEDVNLRHDDVLEVPSIFDLAESYTVDISGAVGIPGTYPWADNMSLEDLVIRAGGLLESASMIKVDVVQRIKDPESTEEKSIRSILLSFSLKDGLIVEGDNEYILRPFDAVYVRTSPGYSKQENVNISGQVMFGGEYAMVRKSERMSELVRRAGGVTSEAYIEGATLMRCKTKTDIAREESAMNLTKSSGRDSLNVESVEISDMYPVAIELDKALDAPGSDYDLVLCEGDELYVPNYIGTVMVCGAVIYPNTMAYQRGANIRHYISRGGGYGSRALKRKTYVIHMDGMVQESRFLSRPRVTPGSMVVVPLKGAPRNPMSAAEVIGMTTSVASLGAIVTSLINMNK